MISEGRVRTGDENLQPDQCAKRADGSEVLDAHIPCELSVRQLTACGHTKAMKYAPQTSDFQKYFSSNNIKFDEVVVGARGAITGDMMNRLLVMRSLKW